MKETREERMYRKAKERFQAYMDEEAVRLGVPVQYVVNKIVRRKGEGVWS